MVYDCDTRFPKLEQEIQEFRRDKSDREAAFKQMNEINRLQRGCEVKQKPANKFISLREAVLMMCDEAEKNGALAQLVEGMIHG